MLHDVKTPPEEIPLITFSVLVQLAAIGIGIALSVVIWVDLWDYSSWTWTSSSWSSNQCYLSDTTANMCAWTFVVALVTFVFAMGIIAAQYWRERMNVVVPRCLAALTMLGTWITLAVMLTIYNKDLESNYATLPPEVADTSTGRKAVRMLTYVMAGAFLYQVFLDAIGLCAMRRRRRWERLSPEDQLRKKLEAMETGKRPRGPKGRCETVLCCLGKNAADQAEGCACGIALGALCAAVAGALGISLPSFNTNPF